MLTAMHKIDSRVGCAQIVHELSLLRLLCVRLWLLEHRHVLH